MFDSEALKTLAQTTFPGLLGIEFDELSSERVRARITWRPDLTGDGRILHGGVLMALADTVGAYGAALGLEADQTTATIESKTNFFRAASEGVIEAESSVVHRGRHSACWETNLTQSGRLLARTVQTQILIRTNPAGQ